MQLQTRPARIIDNQKTGAQARKERCQMRIQSKDMAKAMRISKATFSKLEHGSGKWSQELVDRFNAALAKFKIPA